MYCDLSKQHDEFVKGTMESGNHFKNGASPKSPTSRRNILLRGLPLLLFLCIGFASCSKDDDNEDGGNDNHLLAGKWEAVEEYTQEADGSWELLSTYEPGQCIWVFDETHLVVHDENDLMNGQKTPFSYNASKQELTVIGMVTASTHVFKLTQNELELESILIEIDDDNIPVTKKMKIVFKKIA
jgi:hypothetical protein